MPDGVEAVAAAVAILAGSILGSWRDPVPWVVLVSCVAFGALRWRPHAPLIAATLAAALTVVAALPWWQEFGMADQWMKRGAWIFFIYLVIAFASWGVGRLFARKQPVVGAG
jgi:hypothetical protein